MTLLAIAAIIGTALMVAVIVASVIAAVRK